MNESEIDTIRVQLDMLFEKLGCSKEELALRLRAREADRINIKQLLGIKP